MALVTRMQGKQIWRELTFLSANKTASIPRAYVQAREKQKHYQRLRSSVKAPTKKLSLSLNILKCKIQTVVSLNICTCNLFI